ncbi:hypothetical protein CRG98_008864 [Punica granatum]|uniref:Uncharacterized protein n=1 Tax=Punica granatum TaxID=22663 RepID=A0A2I0KQ94_PUNGR|nr:hypothetical protein CRG98_008864 [Punica granatum]
MHDLDKESIAVSPALSPDRPDSDEAVTHPVCAHPNFRLIGARMRATKCNSVWEGSPSQGRATDAREKESTLPVYNPKVEGR